MPYGRSKLTFGTEEENEGSSSCSLDVNKIKPACTRIVAISGSLQSRSSNTAVIQLAAGLADERTHVDFFDALDKLPYFNPDLDILPAPAAVAELRQRLASADAVLIASPEICA